MDVCFYEVFREEELALRRFLGDEIRCRFAPHTIQESQDEKPPARLISIRTHSVVPNAWAGVLSGILTRSMGYDHLLRFRQHSHAVIPLGYLEEYSARAVAEHAVMLLLSLFRKLPQQMMQFQRFERDGLTGRECEGKNLLVVGVGRIGKIVASIGNALGMTVRGVDIVRDKPNISYVSFAEGVVDADAIISCMNLTDSNAGYFNVESLSKVRRGCIFVNIARGEESPVADLVQLLADGILGGVGLDVYDAEPDLANALRSPAGLSSPQAAHVKALLQHPNAICTPHNAFNSEEAVERKSKMSVDQIQHFVAHGRFLWQLT
ncbi:MAG: hypothetical protein NTV54_05530 [Ignavibacteriales bacterium]|nr:hypothetical protein [Ignavibacteriales bacterium]